MIETDILIVGGGIAGASLGARLAPKRRTMLIEAEDVCGRHATGRSAAFWQASLGGNSPERQLTLASKAMFDRQWPGAPPPLLRPRGALHLTGPSGDAIESAPIGDHAPVHLDREALDRMVPGLRAQWTGAWLEESCADIDVAAFHVACLAAIRRGGGQVRPDVALRSAAPTASGWRIETNGDPIRATLLVNAAGAWGDDVARRAGVAGLGLEPRRRTVVQLRVARRGLTHIPFVTDLHQSFYFKGEGDQRIWVCPLDETVTDPCDASPEEIDVALAIDRFERAVDWPVEAVEHKWAGLRTFAPGRSMKFGLDPKADNFFWCVGQGGMGIQTAPAASLLCACLILGEQAEALAGIDPANFSPR
ncbi:MAG: FAD-binding oxidoreductase [Pseudomonadota bacterium]|nr:FAD-binding oxidoreductase [Pseudomonadota bacterium]